MPSLGGGVCCTGGAITPGSFDQSIMEEREDILVYTSGPLKEGIEVSGFIEATLYISSDVKDTDITLKLIDLYPDGKAYNLDDEAESIMMNYVRGDVLRASRLGPVTEYSRTRKGGKVFIPRIKSPSPPRV